MTAASEARRIALMLNDSKWQEIEEEIRKAIEAGEERGFIREAMDGRSDGQPDIEFPVAGFDFPYPPWRDQPDGVR